MRQDLEAGKRKDQRKQCVLAEQMILSPTDFGDGPKVTTMGGLNCLVFNWKFSSSQKHLINFVFFFVEVY